MMLECELRNAPKTKDNELAKNLGSLIAAKRKSLKLTQGELAEKVGIEQESMSRIETGMITPSLGRLYLLADALDCSIETLLKPASGRKQDQSLALEELMGELDDAERAFALRIIKDFVELSRSRQGKLSKK